MRVTPTTYMKIVGKSEPFGSISNYLEQAVSEFSDATARDKLAAATKLAEIFVRLDSNLAHIGGNLNQAMHRINENAIAGLPNSHLLLNKALPEIQACKELCDSVRLEIRQLTFKIVKGK